MNSHTSRSPMLYTLSFLLVLILGFAAFFSGVKVGADRIEAKYDGLKKGMGAEEFSGSYQQQELVTFYHNVFLPYREFKRDWSVLSDKLARSSSARERTAILKSMEALADKQYAKVNPDAMYSNSPLLQEAQVLALKSLKLFSDASGSVKQGATGTGTLKALQTNTYAAAGVKYGLQAQKAFYDSMLKWGAKANSAIPATIGDSRTVTLTEWKKMPLLLKNDHIAGMMLNRAIFQAYDPQDVTAKIDNLIQSGTAAELKLGSVQSALNVLISTGAIQEQDFLKWQEQYYPNETIPQVPFFYE